MFLRIFFVLLLQFTFISAENTSYIKAEKEAKAAHYWTYPYPEIVDYLRSQGKDSITIFSYGSLMNVSSAQLTLGKASMASRRPGIAYKVKRLYDRDIPITIGSKWCIPKDSNARGMLNTVSTESVDDLINGVLIDVSLDDIPHVLLREEGYDLLPIVVQEWDVEKQTVRPGYFIAYTFHAPQDSKYTNASIMPRPKYYELTRDAPLQYGPSFYRIWLQTTYLADGKTPVIDWEKKVNNREEQTEAVCPTP